MFAKVDMNIEERLKQIITEHYQAFPFPLVASELGAQLSSEGFWPIPGDDRKLLEVIDGFPEIVVARDGAYAAVADTANADFIHSALEKRKSTRRLRKLPKSLLVAFTARIEDSEVILVQPNPPFKYKVKVAAEGFDGSEDWAELPESERVPGLIIYDLEKLNIEQLDSLYEKIVTWAISIGVKEDELRYSLPVQENFPKKGKSPGKESALDRFIECQDREILDRIVIPADVALLLKNSR